MIDAELAGSGLDSAPCRAVLWDRDSEPPTTDELVILWRRHGTLTSGPSVSIPDRVEDSAERLRIEFLDWICHLARRPLRGQSLLERLSVRPDFSAWWCTRLAEKCNWSKSPWIHHAIKLLALDDWLLESSCSVCRIESDDRLLEHTLCDLLERRHAISCPGRRRPSSRFGDALRSLRHFVGTAAWLPWRVLSDLPLLGLGRPRWRRAAGVVTIVNYLAGLPESGSSDSSERRFWGDLPDALREKHRSHNWLHLPAGGQNPLSAVRLRMRWRHLVRSGGVHVPIGAFCDLRCVLGAVFDWCRMASVGILCREAIRMEIRPGLRLHHLCVGDWEKSLFGTEALNFMLQLRQLERAFHELPHQSIGLYLQENISWEPCLLHAWRAARHGRIIGVAHASVRFWDLRYFESPGCTAPGPDIFAVNGSIAAGAFARCVARGTRMVEVEALRFGHILQGLQMPGEDCSGERGRFKILVLGDYEQRTTRGQFDMLAAALKGIEPKPEVWVRPHPLSPMAPEVLRSVDAALELRSLREALGACDLVYAAAMTTAALEAFVLGVPVVIFLDGKSLNLSPLREISGVPHARDPRELQAAIRDRMGRSGRPIPKVSALHLHGGLPRWRNLLELDESSTCGDG